MQLRLSAEGVGATASFYLVGNVFGAIIFGVLADRFGRKRLFNITLMLYIISTASTALAWDFWSLAVFRLITGAGIGGESAAIGSAVLEFTPARLRGRVHLAIASTYWLGAACGALITVPLLNPRVLPADLGWRFAFGSGAGLALVVLYLRRFIPESPRWLLIHGRQSEAEMVVADIEAETGVTLAHNGAHSSCTETEWIEYDLAPARGIDYWASVLIYFFKQYRERTLLLVILLSTQAFFYNAIFFTYGLILTRFYDVSVDKVGTYMGFFAIGNLLGPILLGRSFDTIGRTPMITATYASSGFLLLAVAWLFGQGQLGPVTQTFAWTVIFLLASAGASGAYLIVAESFPIEVRAGSIALFYAVGTTIGGIAAPWFFGRLIESGSRARVVDGYIIAAGLMLLGAVADLMLGFKSERMPLERVSPSIRSVATQRNRS